MTQWATHSVEYTDDDDCPWRREFYIVPYRPATHWEPAEGGYEIEAHYRDGILWTDELPPDVDFQLTWLADEYARNRAEAARCARDDRVYAEWRERQQERA